MQIQVLVDIVQSILLFIVGFWTGAWAVTAKHIIEKYAKKN